MGNASVALIRLKSTLQFLGLVEQIIIQRSVWFAPQDRSRERAWGKIRLSHVTETDSVAEVALDR